MDSMNWELNKEDLRSMDKLGIRYSKIMTNWE